MSMVSVAIGTAAVGLGGAIMNSNAINNASSAQSASGNQANATDWSMYNQNVARMDPYVQAGNTATGQLNAWNAPGGQGSQQFNYQDYLNSPAMAFQMQQGQLALDRSAASRGVAMTPGTAQSEAAYNQGVGSQYYQQAFNNFQTGQTNRFNQLSAVAGMGENAAAGVGNNGLQTANITGQNTMNAANGAAAGSIADANNWNSALNSGMNGLTNMYAMQNLFGGQQGGIGGTPGQGSNPNSGAASFGNNWGNQVPYAQSTVPTDYIIP